MRRGGRGQALADRLPAGKVLLGGERDGKPLPGFDLGNSPREYTCAVCRGTTLVLTTTNGTRALLRAAGRARLIAAFVNYSAVCEQLRAEARPSISSAPATRARSPWKTPCWPAPWSISWPRQATSG